MVAPGICGSLTVIFNACLKEGCNQEEWKSANITPVHKGGNDDVPRITDQSPCFQLLLRFMRDLSTSSFTTIYRKQDFISSTIWLPARALDTGCIGESGGGLEGCIG